MNGGFRGRARGRRGYVGGGHGQGRGVGLSVGDPFDGTERGVGHGCGIRSPRDKDGEDAGPSVVVFGNPLGGSISGGSGDDDSDAEKEDAKPEPEDKHDEEKKDDKDEERNVVKQEDKKDASGVTLGDWSYPSGGRRGGWGDQRGGRRGGWGDQRGGRARGGFNKRGGGGRGGRGDGRGRWGRGGGGGGGGGFGGYNRWSEPRDPKAGIKSGDSADPGTSRPSGEILEYWSEASAPLLPEVPFEYTPWETDFHIEAREFLEGLRDSREGLLVDERGVPYDDCRMSHGYGQVCQFCDGRNGPWVHKDAKPNDPAFLRYQESILRSPFQITKTNVEASRDVVKLGVEADAEVEGPPIAEGEDFGVIEPKAPEEEPVPPVIAVDDFGMFDHKLSLTE